MILWTNDDFEMMYWDMVALEMIPDED